MICSSSSKNLALKRLNFAKFMIFNLRNCRFILKEDLIFFFSFSSGIVRFEQIVFDKPQVQNAELHSFVLVVDILILKLLLPVSYNGR